MQKHLEEILSKEMSRKEFLATVGLGLASVMGFSSIIKMLTGKHQQQSSGFGYGSSAYGGSKARN